MADSTGNNPAVQRADPATVIGTDTKESTKSIEPAGKIDLAWGSYPHIGKKHSYNPGNLADEGKPLTSPEALLSKPLGNPGRNQKANKEEDPKDKQDNAQKRATNNHDKINKPHLKAKNPSVASQDGGPILEATMKADPGNIAGAVQKALQAMVMIKMMDKLASPAGIASMAAGAMGGGLGNLAKAVGVGNMLGIMGSAMPTLQGGLPTSQLGALNLGMQGMVTGNPVGALAADVVAAAVDTAASVVGVNAALNPSAAIAVAATLGGPALGLTPNTLAYRLALTTKGTTISTSSLIKGIAVATTLEVVDSYLQDQLGTIPKLSGDEHVTICRGAVTPMQTGIGGGIINPMYAAGLIGGDIMSQVANGNLGAAAGAISGAVAGGRIGGVLGAAIGSAVGGAIGNGVGGIVDAGLTKLLGAPLSGLLGVAGKLLPNIGGDIISTVASQASSFFDAPGAVQGAMQEATKTLGLAATGFKITDVFGAGPAEQVQNMHDSMVGKVVENAIAGAVQGAVASVLVNSLPVRLVTQCNGVRITVNATRPSVATAAAVGTIVGAFSQI